MTASLSDLLTAAKNIATAINQASRTYLGVQGMQLAPNIKSAAVVVTGTGRLAVLSVITAHTGGMIYDSKDPGNTTEPMLSIPDVIGIYQINLPFDDGLLVVPVANQQVTISYSIGSAIGYTP